MIDPQTRNDITAVMAFLGVALAVVALYWLWRRERKGRRDATQRAIDEQRWRDYLNDPYWRESNDPADWWKRGKPDSDSDESSGG